MHCGFSCVGSLLGVHSKSPSHMRQNKSTGLFGLFSSSNTAINVTLSVLNQWHALFPKQISKPYRIVPFTPSMSRVCCSGRLMRDRSQSSFSVSYKNMKSPSLQSLDNVSIDSYQMEDADTNSLLERGGANRDALTTHNCTASSLFFVFN